MPDVFLVIDASVARSANDPARHPVSVACARLARILADETASSGVLMSPALQAEWRKHASAFMTSWLVRMELRGQVRRAQDQEVAEFRAHLAAMKDEGARLALEKDAHLTELSILQNSPVASRDDKQRKHLQNLARAFEPIARIQWFNPVTEEPAWENWVRGGCQDKKIFACASA